MCLFVSVCVYLCVYLCMIRSRRQVVMPMLSGAFVVWFGW